MQITSGGPDHTSIKKTADNTQKLIDSMNALNETIKSGNLETSKFNREMRFLSLVLLLATSVQVFVAFLQVLYDYFSISHTYITALILAAIFAGGITLFVFLFAIYLLRKHVL